MPGPQPSYRPVFSEEDLADARRVASSHHESYQRVLRARLALLLADQPTLSSPQAARRLGVQEQWVILAGQVFQRDSLSSPILRPSLP
mgnify:CR=1 FL=1